MSLVPENAGRISSQEGDSLSVVRFTSPGELQAPRSKGAIPPDSTWASDVKAWASTPAGVAEVSSTVTHERDPEQPLFAPGHCIRCLWDPPGLKFHSQPHEQPAAPGPRVDLGPGIVNHS